MGRGGEMAKLVIWRFKFIGVFLLSFLITGMSYAADKAVAPLHLDGAKTVNANQVIELLQKTPDLVIIDSRMNDRPQGYIEGSINLADIDTSCETLASAIKAFASPVMFYCNGPRCRRSEKAIKIALQCGYKEIYWYRGGFEDWMAQGFPYISN